MRNLIGVFFIIGSAIGFGAMAIFARLAYEAGAAPTTLLFLRFGIASLLMFFLTLLRGFSLPRGRVLLILVLMGALGYAGQSFCYFTALTMASAGLVALLLYLYPAIVTLLSVLIFKEPITKRKVAALLLALAGMVLTIGPEGGGQPLGIILSLGAAFIYAAYILVGSTIAKDGAAIPFSTVIITSAALVYGGVIALQGASFPATLTGWISVFAIAMISTALAIVAFLAGLERVGPTNAATLSTAEPLVTVVLAALVLGERMTPSRILGGIMILVAVIVLARGGMTVGRKT